MDEFLRIVGSPITAMVLTIALGGIAVSGKFSQALANSLLAVAWMIGSVGLLRSGPRDVRLNVAISLGQGVVLSLISYVIRPTPESTDNTEQAFVSADSIFIQSALAEGQKLTINVVIRNSSAIPVWVTTKRGFLWRKPIIEDLNQLEDVGGEVQVSPWGQFTQQVVAKLPFSKEDVYALQRGTIVFSVFGRIAWREQSGQTGESRYCAYFNPESVPFLKFCDFGNSK